MSSALIDAGLIALTASALFLLVLLAFDRLAPMRFIKERHDLALTGWLVVPLVFALALQPGSAPEEIEFLPDGVNAAIAEADAAPTVTATRPASANPVANLLPRGLVPRDLPWAALVFVLWMTGSALLLARLLVDLTALLALRLRSTPLTLPPGLVLSRRVDLRQAGELPSPLMAGYFRPAVYLPTGFTLDASARPILEHEIAHLTRGDAWTVLGLRILGAVFWWVLPLRLVDRHLSRTREALCDEIAARITGEPIKLAHALLDTAQRQLVRPSLALAAGSGKTALARRIQHLSSIDVHTKRTPVMRMALLLPALVTIALVATPKVGASVNEERRVWNYDVEDVSPLYHAAHRGRLADIRAMLEAGADPNEISLGDGAPLFAAIRSGRRDVFDLLMQYGADPELAVDGDGSPMIAAARNGERDMLEAMIASGASINAGVAGDGNPLIAAVQVGDRNMVEFLLEAGADPNAYIWADETPMVAAAQNGDIEIAEVLAEAGADLSLTVLAPNRMGLREYRSPISEARRRGHARMEAWLERRGAQHQPPAE
ncbi:MAG: ankyrin repeat domain-containing protein [Pseudomonadota bacterium]|nr:ankyrin repeat domain-containing protein [Pseudomonadota bacterium]